MKELTAYRNTVTGAPRMDEEGAKVLAWSPGQSTRNYQVDVEPVTVQVRPGYRLAPSHDDETLLYPDDLSGVGMTVAAAVAAGLARVEPAR